MERKVKKLALVILLLLVLACLGAQARRDPDRAALYSLVLPGAGQIYNHAYLKAGLVIGIQGYLIGTAIYNDGQRADFQRLAQTTSNSALAQEYQARSDDYKDRVNNDIWWIGITAALSVIDAYVDAHLADFESQKEKLRLRFEGDQISLEYRF